MYSGDVEATILVFCAVTPWVLNLRLHLDESDLVMGWAEQGMFESDGGNLAGCV